MIAPAPTLATVAARLASVPPAEAIAAMIAAAEAEMATLVAGKPSVTDGHSDGKRVRYVRAETVATVLRMVAAIIAAEA